MTDSFVINSGDVVSVSVPEPTPVEFVGVLGPQGPTGATGSVGATGATGPAGTTSWNGLIDKPAVIAAGVTQADARSAIAAQESLGYTAENVANKAQANGYASLDNAGKVPAGQLPSSVMEYQGTYNASTNSPALADGSGNAGDVYRVSVAGTRNFGSGNVTLRVGDYVIYSGSIWQKSATTDNVASVAGLAGDVSSSALKTAIALDAVDNTSDANKPVSTAAASALAGKLDSGATAAAATKLATARTLGPVDLGATGSASFDGTANVTPGVTGSLPQASVTNLTTDLAGKQAVMSTVGVKTSAYAANVNELIPADATSAAFTVTLPSAPANGSRVIVKKIDTSANAVTVACSGSDRFNSASGTTTRLLQIQSEAITAQYNSALAVWYVVATDTPLAQLDTRFQAASSNLTSFASKTAPSGAVVGDSDTQTLSGKTLSAPALTGVSKLSSGGSVEVYNTADQTTNYERCTVGFISNQFKLQTQRGNGTVNIRPIQLYAGGQFTIFGTAQSGGGNANLDFGCGSTNNAAILTVTGTNSGTALTQFGVSIAPTINQTSSASYTALLINPTETATGSGTKRLIDAQVGGSTKFNVDNAGNAYVGGTLDLGNASDTTLSRSAAGELSVEGAVVSTATNTLTLQNKTLTAPKISSGGAPATATSTGTTGQIAWDANYFYVCTATNTWVRAALATW